MISRKTIVALVLIVSAGAFAVGAYVYQRNAQADQQAIAISQSEHLVRMHSPVLGPREAPVTIVEFFDPACETCRAFHPIVKDLMRGPLVFSAITGGTQTQHWRGGGVGRSLILLAFLFTFKSGIRGVKP